MNNITDKIMFRWKAGYRLEACVMYDRLIRHGLHPRLEAHTDGGDTLSLPESELPALGGLQKQDPTNFGRC